MRDKPTPRRSGETLTVEVGGLRKKHSGEGARKKKVARGKERERGGGGQRGGALGIINFHYREFAN